MITQIKCGFQNCKKFAHDLSDSQFLKKNVALRKKNTANYDSCYTNCSNLNIETGGPGSAVGIATGYGLDGPAIESLWGEIFGTCPDRTWGPPSLPYNGYRVFRGGKERPGRDAYPSPPSSAVVKKG